MVSPLSQPPGPGTPGQLTPNKLTRTTATVPPLSQVGRSLRLYKSALANYHFSTDQKFVMNVSDKTKNGFSYIVQLLDFNSPNCSSRNYRNNLTDQMILLYYCVFFVYTMFDKVVMTFIIYLI